MNESGPASSRKPSLPLTLDGSSQAGARLEESQVECETTLVGELRRAPRGREPGDATSDDNEPYRLSLTR